MDHYPHRRAEVAGAMVMNAATRIILADHPKVGVAARMVSVRPNISIISPWIPRRVKTRLSSR